MEQCCVKVACAAQEALRCGHIHSNTNWITLDLVAPQSSIFSGAGAAPRMSNSSPVVFATPSQVQAHQPVSLHIIPANVINSCLTPRLLGSTWPCQSYWQAFSCLTIGISLAEMTK